MYNQIESNKRKTWLLMAIFAALIITIGFFLDYYYKGGSAIVIFAVVISIVSALSSYYTADKVALWSTGAKLIQKEDNPYVYRMVENLCIASGVPTPKVHIIDSPALNAFATGRDPEHASIAFTTGIISALENEELEGVIAHELSHVKNYDIRLMTVVVVLVGTIALIGDIFLRMQFRGGRRSSKEGNGAAAAMVIIGVLFLILSPIVAELIKLAISRKREYLADASGSLITRYPEGLARALEKIKQSATPLATANSATAHLFIANPFAGKGISSFFSTHPPIDDRIKKLREI